MSRRAKELGYDLIRGEKAVPAMANFAAALFELRRRNGFKPKECSLPRKNRTGVSSAYMIKYLYSVSVLYIFSI